MMRMILIAAIIFGFALPGFAQDAPQPKQPDYSSNQVLHPQWFIKVTDWSFFNAARVGMLSSVVIENTADIAYKDINVRISMYTNTTGAVGQTIATNTAVLPIILPPNSKAKYLKGGMPVGGGAQSYRVSDIQVLSATPINN